MRRYSSASNSMPVCTHDYKCSPKQRILYQKRNMDACTFCKGLRRKERHYIWLREGHFTSLKMDKATFNINYATGDSSASGTNRLLRRQLLSRPTRNPISSIPIQRIFIGRPVHRSNRWRRAIKNPHQRVGMRWLLQVMIRVKNAIRKNVSDI